MCRKEQIELKRREKNRKVPPIGKGPCETERMHEKTKQSKWCNCGTKGRYNTGSRKKLIIAEELVHSMNVTYRNNKWSSHFCKKMFYDLKKWWNIPFGKKCKHQTLTFSDSKHFPVDSEDRYSLCIRKWSKRLLEWIVRNFPLVQNRILCENDVEVNRNSWCCVMICISNTNKLCDVLSSQPTDSVEWEGSETIVTFNGFSLIGHSFYD